MFFFRAWAASNFLLCAQKKVTKEKGTPRLALRVPSVPHRFRGSIDGRSLARDGDAASMRRPYGPDPASVPVLGCVEGGLGVVVFSTRVVK